MIATAGGITKFTRQSLLSEAAQFVRRKQTELPAQWVSRHGYLDDQVEAAGGRYDLSQHPWFAQPINHLDDQDVRFVNLMMSPQLGKTILLIQSVLCCADQYPCPAMCVLPNIVAKTEFRDRLYGNCLSSPKTRQLPPPESHWNTRHIDLGGMRVYLAASGEKQALRGRRCKRVWLSEIDVYEPASAAGDPLRSAEQRVKAFLNWQIWKESSPVSEPSRIGEAFYDSRQHYWHCPCPHCNHWQEMRFFVHKDGKYAGCGGVEGWKDDAGARLTQDDAREAAYYCCEQGCRIENEDIRPMLLKGMWVAEGESIENGQLVGEPIRAKRSMGYHLWAMFNESMTLGELAAEWIKSCESNTVSDFFQNTLAKPYSRQAARPDWAVLGTRNAGDHPRGVVPEWVWFLTAGIDVQLDHVKWVIRGWSGEGRAKSSALISWGIFEQKPGDESLLIKSDLLAVLGLLQDSFPVRGGKGNPQGHRHLQILLGGIDCGHRSLEVHRLLAKVKQQSSMEDRLIAVRGDANVARAQRWRHSEIKENSRTGVEYEEKHEEYQLAVTVFKEELSQLQAADPQMPGKWLVTSDAMKVGVNYLKEVVNEAPVMERKPSGKEEIVWKRVSRSVGVDFWDGEVYASACAEMIVDSRFGDAGWDAEKWLAMSHAKPKRYDREGVSGR
jgi:phage terminase large subunit GpA-like protein